MTQRRTERKAIADAAIKFYCVAGLLAIGLALCFLAGCSTPHRSSVSSHEADHELDRYEGRADGLLTREKWRETWADKDSGGAIFFFSDPASQGMCIKHTNQPALGGSSWMMLAPFSVVVDSNLGPVITASGTALGNIGGAAVKAAVK